MNKGRFSIVRRGCDTYLELHTSVLSETVHINCNNPIINYTNAYFRLDENVDENVNEIFDVSDFVNSLCFQILDSHGLVYNQGKDRLERVAYTWDHNLIPGERFIGLEIDKLDGTEKCWQDLFPNLGMKLDVLSAFRYDLTGYIGLMGHYRLYLPYTETNLELYKSYLEYSICRYKNIPRREKI